MTSLPAGCHCRLSASATNAWPPPGLEGFPGCNRHLKHPRRFVFIFSTLSVLLKEGPRRAAYGRTTKTKAVLSVTEGVGATRCHSQMGGGRKLSKQQRPTRKPRHTLVLTHAHEQFCNAVNRKAFRFCHGSMGVQGVALGACREWGACRHWRCRDNHRNPPRRRACSGRRQVAPATEVWPGQACSALS